MPYKNPEDKKACLKRWRLNNLERYREHIRKGTAKWRKKHPARYVASYMKQNARTKADGSQKAHYKALRDEMLAAYGQSCACCGEDTREFLTLEHLRGDGAKWRRKVGGGVNMLRYLRKKGWPKDGLAILCFNCNSGKHINGGICPHETAVAKILKLA
jgi:hypothetical protein